MTNAIADYARQTIRDTTALGMDYNLDELDDLGSRKQEVPVSGDDMARIVRAQRGVARATGEVDNYVPRVVNNTVERNLWTASERTVWTARSRGNRRVAAIGDGTGATLSLSGLPRA